MDDTLGLIQLGIVIVVIAAFIAATLNITAIVGVVNESDVVEEIQHDEDVNIKEPVVINQFTDNSVTVTTTGDDNNVTVNATNSSDGGNPIIGSIADIVEIISFLIMCIASIVGIVKKRRKSKEKKSIELFEPEQS